MRTRDIIKAMAGMIDENSTVEIEFWDGSNYITCKVEGLKLDAVTGLITLEIEKE